MEVTRLRPYKVVDVVESDFLALNNDRNDKFCVDDLAKSGLTPDDILASAPGNLKLTREADAGYHIPYFNLDGTVATCPGNNYNSFWRLRLHYPIPSRNSRYLQTDGDRAHGWGLPSFIPYCPPLPKEWNRETIYCVEGEKKTAAVIKFFRIPAFGLAGCQMWRDPDGSGGIHPWIAAYARQYGTKKISIIADPDIFRYDIASAYGTFADAIKRAGFDIEILHPPSKIDDLIVERLREKTFDESLLAHLERIDVESLVQSNASLAKNFNLSFKSNNQGVKTVYQNISNMMILMENHRAFPKIWTDTDTNRIMVGELEIKADVTEVELLRYFQHNLGFEKVKKYDVVTCIQALAGKSERSPMLDYIRSLQWDGQSRLYQWLQLYWGVEDTEYIQEIGIKWLISACARLDKPGCGLDWMLITVGPQGTGKTSMPEIFFGDGYYPIYGDQGDKDLHLIIAGHLCLGFDELDSFNKKETSHLKAMITRSTDEFRRPYGRTIEKYPRRSVLYGCGNRMQFLQYDSSGYRRYAIVEVNRILDFRGVESVRDQLWAEAWSLYSQGSLKWWEIEGASEHAQEYVIPNVLQEEIINWTQAQMIAKHATMIKDGYFCFTMAQLMAGIGEGTSVKNPHVTGEIAAILRSMGYERKSIRSEGIKYPEKKWCLKIGD